MQVLVVIIVIYWPGAVTCWIDTSHGDASAVKIELPQMELPPPEVNFK